MSLSQRYKYPRTPHLSFSPGVGSDDLKLDSNKIFANCKVVVAEKLDGENTTFYPDYIHARSLDSRHHRHSKIVWDATNLRRDFRQQVISLSRKYGALVTLVIFQCSEATYFKRNQERENRIPENVLIKQLRNMEFPEFDEGDRIIVVDKIGATLAKYGIC